jgi:predicted 3-demethylubiquinone-9 3-methyltransferase (glyoxalase superfamily)
LKGFAMQKITPFLWFDNQAEEAAKFYVSVFKNSKMGAVSRYGDGMPLPKGTVMTAAFEIDGQKFTALNGGPEFKFTPAVSFVIDCDTQKDIDYYWDKLASGGGEEVQCGWVRDKYGLSWQIVPTQLPELVRKSSDKVMHALLKMKKLDIAALQKAAAA